MEALGDEAVVDGRIYVTGGASAVLVGWRESTIDVDIKMVPEHDRLFRAIPRLKESLELNVELASPSDFIPELSGWEERSPLIMRAEKLWFHHYDFYSQSLAKLERGHARDVDDVREMIARRLVEPRKVLSFFEEIEPNLYRYPAIDPRSFRHAVQEMIRPHLA